MADELYVVRNFIAGESVAAKDGLVYDLIDPSHLTARPDVGYISFDAGSDRPKT